MKTSEFDTFAGEAATQRRTVAGQVLYDDGAAFRGDMFLFHEADQGIIRLGQDANDPEGRYTIGYELAEDAGRLMLRVAAFDSGGKLCAEKTIEVSNLVEIVDLEVAREPLPQQLPRIEGRLVFEHGRPAGQVQLRLYRRNFGGTTTQLGQTSTLAGGEYTFSYNPGGRAVSLEIRAVKSATEEILLSKPLNHLAHVTTLNLVAPASLQPATAEYARLSSALIAQVGQMANLAGLKENAERQDLTVLNRATGWDARLIALATLSERLGADTQVAPLAREGLYGLLRAGLPSDKRLLAQVGSDVIEQILKKVRDTGIIALTDQAIGQFKQQFETFATTVRLNMPAPGSRSTYGELLTNSGLSASAQTSFARTYLSHRGDGDQLWESARAAGLTDVQISRLQVQGKLAFLTANSAALTNRLQQSLTNGDPAQLVERDLYRVDPWIDEIDATVNIPPARRDNLTAADRQALETLIPPAFAAPTVEARRRLWAEDLARKVRLSYPTHVVQRTIEQDTADTFKLGAARTSTATLLKNAASQGFRLGRTPPAAFFKSHPAAKGTLTDSDYRSAQQEVSKLQRVYQITPSNAEMPILLGLGLTSAYAVVAVSEDEFMEIYGAKFSTQQQARLVYQKARQVSNVTYNLFAIAKSVESSLPIHGISAPVEVRESVKNELIKHFPTMESLFGSLDFCECEHCRSVLSPAAYLVDLLQFIDIEPEVWGNFLEHWKANHNNQEYGATYKKPYEALIERRPDLPHIPLTCQNTHTALPYIDVVNEILEYYVAHDALAEDAARDTGDATSAELLAEPQNVIREAYDKLRAARYPLTLPFDLWLETVRQFCDYFETPLARVLEVFRPGERLTDREREFIEALRLSPAEWAIFTDPDPLGNGKWHELYGYTTARPAIQSPANTTDATLTILDSTAGQFAVGDVCTYFDVSANALHGETKTISVIGAAGSGGAGRTRVTFTGVWNTPPVANDLLVYAAHAVLRSAKTLARRLDVTYKELVDIVRTAFVNPQLDELVVLERLGVGIHSVLFCRDPLNKAFYELNKDLLDRERSELSAADRQRYDALTPADWQKLREVQAFEQRLQAFSATSNIPPAQLETVLQAIPFDQILVLADPDPGCNFDLTMLRYASGRAADDIAFLKINLFVRLWRKLGWTIEETGRALHVFLPRQAPFERANLSQRPLRTALIYLAHLIALDERLRLGKQSRLKLLTLWSDLGTTGKKPLYGQLFLTRSVLKSDDVFDHPLGQYLAAAGIAALAEARWHRVQLEHVVPADQINPAPFAGRPRIELSYDPVQEIQYLAYQGVLTNTEETALRALSSSPALPTLLDAVQVKAAEFALVKGHLPALQGPLGLTADDIGTILQDAGTSLETAALSLVHVSLLYRYGLLAKALKLTVRELIALKQLSGLDPFALLHPNPLAGFDQDYPFTQTLRFVALAVQVRESGLSIEDLAYLLRHRFDETGTYRPNDASTLALLKTLAEGVRAIRAEHAVPEDPGAMAEAELRRKLGLVLPPDIVETFLAMLNGTVEYTATTANVAPANQLTPAAFAAEPSIRELRYNQARQEQKLTFRGVLSDAQQAALLARHAQSPVLTDLLEKVQQQANLFFDKHLLKQEPGAQPATGFLDKADFALLFEPDLALAPGETEQDRIRNRRTKLADAFLPFLQQRLIRQFIIQTLTAHTAADPALVESLLTDTRLLGLTQAGEPVRSLLDVFAATAERGLTATFFDSADLSNELRTVVLADADLSLKDTAGNPLKPTGTDSARIEGYLEVPQAGAYRFYAVLGKQNSQAELRFAHLPAPVLAGTAINPDDEVGNGPGEYVELKPGSLYRFTLELRNLDGSSVRLLVQGETLPKDRLAQLALYPLATIAAAERAIVLLTKALQLLQSLGIGEREARYLLTHAGDFAGLDLKNLPTRAADDLPAGARTLFAHFLRLAGYARLKRDLAAGTADLIAIFEANRTGNLNNVYPLIARLTRRDEATVGATARAMFGSTPAFASEEPLQRLWEALHVVEQFGVPVSALVGWTRIASQAAAPDQRFGIARDLKEAIKARFEPETWQGVAQPIFDTLRRRQRDALAAHVMHQHGFARLEQLYEYFLLDPGMEPVVQTSRIRLAIASVQLFVQRCLLNLERSVHPSAIMNAKQWEWMKRYRVWEANRKIFLFPENWLEPEFRDDKTHLFGELEGALLQGDVSNDLVEDAFLSYLRRLEELARLDLVAMHLEDQADPAQNTLHVIGRTYSRPHRYFYRRYAHQIWTPWVPVSAEIEGDHLAPVIWRDRLYLFWATFIEKAEQPATATSTSASEPLTDISVSDIVGDLTAVVAKKRVDVFLHWSEYFQGEWTTRESSGFAATLSKPVDSPFKPGEVFIHVTKEAGDSGGVLIHLGGAINSAFFLASRNSAPEERPYTPSPESPYGLTDVLATRYAGTDKLTVRFKQRISTEPNTAPNIETPEILRQGTKYTLLPCDNTITLGAPAVLDAQDPAAVATIESGLAELAALMKPIFYQDNQHTLFVEPNVTERTIEQWKEWVTHTPSSEPEWKRPGRLDEIVVIPEFPELGPIPEPEGPRPGPIDFESIYQVKDVPDWLVNPITGLEFGGVLIGPDGQTGLEIRTQPEAAGAIQQGGKSVNVHPGSGVASGKVVVLPAGASFDKSGLTLNGGGLNVVSERGFNSSLGQNLAASKNGVDRNR